MSLRLAFALVLTCAPALAAAQAGCAPATVYLVRHAEKADASGDPDVVLSEAGQRSADALRDWFGARPLDAIYATHLRRTQQTVAPLALARDLELRVLPAGNTPGLVKRLRTAHCGAHVLVAGHSNTVPEIAQALGAAAFAIAEEEYGTVFVFDPAAATLRRESWRTTTPP